MTSFDVIRKLRKLLNIKKIWHTGTLDPLATWCLLVATWSSTKLISMLEKLEKTYICQIRIDGTSASLDLWTEVIPHSIDDINLHTESELRDFILSQTSQIPPKYSALHIDGKRAYDLARAWEEFEIQERKISVKNVEILGFAPPVFDIEFTLSSGGYVRSFAPLIWQFFWTPGGYVTKLHREAMYLSDKNILTTRMAQSIDDFDAEKEIDLRFLFPNIDFYEVDEQVYNNIKNWKILDSILIGDHLNIWQKIFITHKDFPISLLECSPVGLQIIKNNISYSHKIYRE